ncbi:MAG: M23 family metallopeptidase [Bacteroidota bacterium]|nr:M23 family metallopeptidase [Bacteroidota bacterium]
MMRSFFITLGFCLISFLSFPQRNVDSILDTIETSEGPVILYKNFTWEFLQNEPVMMSSDDDSTGLFTHEWLNDQVFSYMGPNKRDSIKDTVLTLTTKDRNFTMPMIGKLFRGFTNTHKGLDIGLTKGDPVAAAFDGVVRYAKYNRGGFGNLVIIRHYNGLETYYAHLSKFRVQVNQLVHSGDIIGYGGSTGRSKSPHLHFEIRYKDVPLDPLRVLDFDNHKLYANNLPITKKFFFPSIYDGTAIYHKVRKGETLGRIAKKYRVSVKELCSLNRIKPSSHLKPGRSIRVK